MIDTLVHFVSSWPPWLAVATLAAIPVTELRAAIPLGIHYWSLSPGLAYGFAVLGNLLPFFPLYFGLEAARSWCTRFIPWLVRPIDAMLARGERKLNAQYVKYGAFALFLFTAIPLPMTGLWTATFAAVALKIPVRAAFTAIAGGVLAAGLIVTILSLLAGAVSL